MIEHNDTSHPIEEFKDFPWHLMDATWLRRCGGIGRSNRGEPTITLYREDGSMDRWCVPEALVSLCENYRRNGANEVRTTINSALELEVPRAE